MQLTDLRIKLGRFFATAFAIFCAFTAYWIAGESIGKGADVLLWLVVLVVGLTVVGLMVWGFCQKDVVWVRLVAVLAVIAALVVPIFAHGVLEWFVHLWSLRGFVAALVLTVGLVVGSLGYKSNSRRARRPRVSADSTGDMLSLS